MEKNLDELLCILPFEKECFSDSTLKVSYVGHPLVSRIQEHVFTPIAKLEGKKIVAFFPGSRIKEIERTFPLYVQLIEKLTSLFPDVHFAISVTRKELEPMLKKQIKETDRVSLIPSEQTYDLMRMAYLAVAKSGTVTLELALHHIPTVVTYAATKLDIFIAQKILRVDLPYYSLPNILCKKKVFPELIGPYFTYDELEKQVLNLLKTSTHLTCKQECQKLSEILGTEKASKQAALQVLQLLSNFF